MPQITPRGQTETALNAQIASTQLGSREVHIEEITFANLGLNSYADNDWVGMFNVRWIGEGGVAETSNWGITSQATTCFYFMHPILRTDFVDFMFFGRAG
jgi:hypothetical protein